MIKVTGNRIEIETRTLTAKLLNGWLVSLRSKDTGDEYIANAQPDKGCALELVYANNEAIPISAGPMSTFEAFQITNSIAEVRYHNWDGDGILLFREDEENGDLLIEPSAYSTRPGVRSVRYNLKNLRHDLRLVAPLSQGIEIDFDDPFINGFRTPWPFGWQAGMVVAAGIKGGVWIHVRDSEFRFKTLNVGAPGDPFGFGFESDNYGPITELLSAGGLVWRINVYKGDWHVPAAIYRDWLWEAYDLKKQETLRPEWLDKLSLAITWCPGDLKLLDALSKKIDPRKVIIHFPNWRTHEYDEDYPYFQASDTGRVFVAKCKGMGFHVMPHCTSMAIDSSLPEFSYLADFTIRDLETGRRRGWCWVDNSDAMGVPGSHIMLMNRKSNKVMYKVHTAFPTWHSILREHIREAVEDMDLENVFIDTPHCLYNVRQSLINNMPTTKGLLQEVSHLQAIGRNGRPLYIGGESLNEITMQRLSFGQIHLSSFNDTEILARTGKCDLNRFMFGKLVCLFGYNNVHGNTKDSEAFMRANLDHGAIPTIQVRSAEEIINPNPAITKMIKMANEL